MRHLIHSRVKRKQDYSRLFLLVSLLVISACHPPVENYLNQSYQHTQSWLGAPAAELILLKGNPEKITYLGWQERASVESEYWTPELDRFMYYFREYGSRLPEQTLKPSNVEHYQSISTNGPWLMTFTQPVRTYRSEERNCVEFFVIGHRGLIIEAGYQGTYLGDHKHCPVPSPRPNVSVKNLGWLPARIAQ